MFEGGPTSKALRYAGRDCHKYAHWGALSAQKVCSVGFELFLTLKWKNHARI